MTPSIKIPLADANRVYQCLYIIARTSLENKEHQKYSKEAIALLAPYLEEETIIDPETLKEINKQAAVILKDMAKDLKGDE